MRHKSFKSLFLMLLTIAAIWSLTGCNGGDPSTSSNSGPLNADSAINDTAHNGMIRPKGPKPAWAPDIHPEMLAVIEKLESYGAPPVETLNAVTARMNPTPTVAVMDLIKENHIRLPVPQIDTVGKNIPVNGGTIHIRIYTPKAIMRNYPLILYIHGGGWVIADMNTYDASAIGICEQTGSVVVSVNYRQGPENKFPTAHQDCFAAYQWMLKNASSMKGDTSRVGILGESAGGNLAANVSIMARDKRIKMPMAEVLVYPIAQSDTNTASYQKNAIAKPLNRSMMVWFYRMYLPSMKMASDPRIDLTKANLKGLPPTTIITAELDPLQSDGQILRDKMKLQGVEVTYQNYNGVTHEFFGMAAIVPEAKLAQALASAQLKIAFGK